MNDLISRQAAIDEVVAWLRDRMTDGKNGKPLTERLKALPSAQPEKHTDERTETHTCDLISKQDAIETSLEFFVEFLGGAFYENAQKELIARFQRLPLAQTENDWIPVTKKAHPDTPIRVQVQLDNGWIITAYYLTTYYQGGEWLSVPDCGEPLKDEWIEAWRELPEPYAERWKG